MKRIGLIVLVAVAAVFAGGCGQGGSESSLCDRAVPLANLKQADLSGCDLSFKVLTKADFSGANLSDANLQNANLQNANLQDAVLGGAILRLANLQGANLERADLQDANLESADLSGADLTGADIEGANLSGAVLKGTVLVDIVGVPVAGPAKFGVFHKKKEGRSTEAGKKLTAEEAAVVLAYWIGEWEHKFQTQLPGENEPSSTHIERWVIRWKEKGKSIEGSGAYKDPSPSLSGLKMSFVEEFDPVKGVFIVQNTVDRLSVEEGGSIATDRDHKFVVNQNYDPVTRIYHGRTVSPELTEVTEEGFEIQIKTPDLVTRSYRLKFSDGKLLSMEAEARRLK